MKDLTNDSDSIDVSLFHRIAHLFIKKGLFNLTEGRYTVSDGIDNWIIEVGADKNGLSVKVRKDVRITSIMNTKDFYRAKTYTHNPKSNVACTEELYSLSFIKLKDFENEMRLQAMILGYSFASEIECIRLVEGLVMKNQQIFIGDSEECFMSDIEIKNFDFSVWNCRTNKSSLATYNRLTNRWVIIESEI